MNSRHTAFAMGLVLACACLAQPSPALADTPHLFTEAQMEAFSGRFPLDPDVLPRLAPYLKKALGPRYPAFLHSIRSQNALRMEDGMLHGFGEQYGTGDRNASLFLFGPRGEVFAAIKRGARIETFGDRRLLEKEPEADHIFRHFVGNAE